MLSLQELLLLSVCHIGAKDSEIIKTGWSALFFKRVLQTCVIGLAKICSWRGLEKPSLPLLYLRVFLTGSAMIFALEYILCCTDTDKSGSNSYFQVALVLFIRNDQCCSKLFSYIEKIGFSCSWNEEQNCATFPLLRGQAQADGLQQKAELLPSSHCGLSCSPCDGRSSLDSGLQYRWWGFSLSCSAKSICE